jgi:hypothetical protein
MMVSVRGSIVERAIQLTLCLRAQSEPLRHTGRHHHHVSPQALLSVVLAVGNEPTHHYIAAALHGLPSVVLDVVTDLLITNPSRCPLPVPLSVEDLRSPCMGTDMSITASMMINVPTP